MNVIEFRDQLFVEGKKLGFTDLELYYEKHSSFGCSIFKGEIDDYDSSNTFGLAVRGLFNGKMGYAYTEKIDKESVSFLLEHMKENAILLEDDPEELFSGDAPYEEKDFYSPSLSGISTKEKISFLKAVEKEIYEFDPRVVQTNYAMIQDQLMEKALYNNKGLALENRNNFFYVAFSVVVKENDEVKTGMHFKLTKDFYSLDPAKVAKAAVEKSLRYLNGKSYPNKTYPVILQGDAAAPLFATFSPSFSAKSVQDNQSRLKGKLDSLIASEVLTLIDNPFLEDGTRSGTFDSEGVPTRELTLVQNGILRNYFHNLKTAKKDGVASTGHGYKSSYKDSIGVSPSNFYVVPGEESFDELMSTMKEGIIITSLSGLHSGANQISGDFSLAANGLYVKDGKIVGPTNQMTIAGNFFELLMDIEKVGNDLEFSPMDYYGYIGSPSLKIKGLAVTVD
ncbi:TldD/PmbA family protein [Ornithinibacillus massiliensis]|uniref:TldD/PmbA family protein n=1 Tax=Ornithinibacillus massiliensis TaxID=1944633 RepID=A0ABS5MEZ8_9BACI|nr:TldD/PmbA family protein [Ornithinibacillus massiliensis]MBS3680328.1 TldD/PmbA family protein [Ornithinibacillus massiliensis]